MGKMNRKVPENFTKLLQKAYGLMYSFVYNGNVVKIREVHVKIW